MDPQNSKKLNQVSSRRQYQIDKNAKVLNEHSLLDAVLQVVEPSLTKNFNFSRSNTQQIQDICNIVKIKNNNGNRQKLYNLWHRKIKNILENHIQI